MTEGVCKIGTDPPDLNKFETYEDWKNNCLLWQGFSDYKKEKMGAMLAYALPNKSLIFGDHVQKDLFSVHPVSQLLNDVEGVDKVIKFLDGHIGKAVRENELEAFEKIWSFRRASDQNILEYLREHERYYNKARSLGITFTDNCSEFIVTLGAKLNTTQAELVKGVIDITKETKGGNMYNAVKQKMRDMLSDSLGNIVTSGMQRSSADAFVAEHQEAFAAWKNNSSYKKNYTSNYNANKNSNYKKSSSNYASNGYRSVPTKTGDRDARDMNPTNPVTGKPLKCKSCGSFRHLNRDCTYNKGINNNFNRKKGRVYLVNTQDSDEEEALLSQFEKVVSEGEEGKEESDCNPNLVGHYIW